MGSAAGTPKDDGLIYMKVPNVTKSGLRKSGHLKISLNEDDILLVYLKGRIHAFQEKCPHQGGPLELGEIEELPDKSSHCIKCPWHSWKFNIVTGDCVFPDHQSNKRLTVYPVTSEKEEIRIGFSQLSPKCFQDPPP